VKKIIGQCGMCPFAGRDHPYHEPVCTADLYLNESDEGGYSRRFNVRNEYGMTVYPKPPPDWCPLRRGDVVLTVQTKETPER
jgi:hypothetical protein